MTITPAVDDDEDAQPEAERIKKWVTEIRSHMARSVEAILDTGQALIDAKADCAYGEFASVCVRVFHGDTGSVVRIAEMYMAVARSEQIRNSVSTLPPAYSTLYELSRVPKKEFNKAVKTGHINPTITRKGVVALMPPPKLCDCGLPGPHTHHQRPPRPEYAEPTPEVFSGGCMLHCTTCDTDMGEEEADGEHCPSCGTTLTNVFCPATPEVPKVGRGALVYPAGSKPDKVAEDEYKEFHWFKSLVPTGAWIFESAQRVWNKLDDDERNELVTSP